MPRSPEPEPKQLFIDFDPPSACASCGKPTRYGHDEALCGPCWEWWGDIRAWWFAAPGLIHTPYLHRNAAR